MSLMGQEQTSCGQTPMSALRLKAEIPRPGAGTHPLPSFDRHQCRLDLNDLRAGETSKGGKNETVISSVVLVRTRFYPVRMAGLVRRASDGMVRPVLASISDPALRAALQEAHAERLGLWVAVWPVTLLVLSQILEWKMEE